MKYEIIIGSDNKTHQIDKAYFDTAINIISRFYDGFSIATTAGFYKGVSEDSIIITVFTSKSETKKIKQICAELKSALNQESILVTRDKQIKHTFY